MEPGISQSVQASCHHIGKAALCYTIFKVVCYLVPWQPQSFSFFVGNVFWFSQNQFLNILYKFAYKHINLHEDLFDNEMQFNSVAKCMVVDHTYDPCMAIDHTYDYIWPH